MRYQSACTVWIKITFVEETAFNPNLFIITAGTIKNISKYKKGEVL